LAFLLLCLEPEREIGTAPQNRKESNMGFQIIKDKGNGSETKTEKAPEPQPAPMSSEEKLDGLEDRSAGDRKKLIERFLHNEEIHRSHPNGSFNKNFRDPRVLQELLNLLKNPSEEGKKEKEGIEHLVQSLESFLKNIFEKFDPFHWFLK